MGGLFAKKPLTSVLADAEKSGVKRVLGPWALTALGVGAIIGAGIFVATGEAAKTRAGPALIVSYLLAGFVCALAALCYAEFAAMVAPRPVVVKKPSDRAKKEFAKLAAWYKALGTDFDPLK